MVSSKNTCENVEKKKLYMKFGGIYMGNGEKNCMEWGIF
jgi:hypothetical protein